MDQFTVTRKLGRAMYGAVWLCQHKTSDVVAPAQGEGDGKVVVPTTTFSTSSSSTVAIKQVDIHAAKEVLLANPSLDNPAQERRIARFLTQLGGHAHVLQFQSDFIESGCWHLVMENCEGGDLLERIRTYTGDRLAERDALRYFHQIARGVQFLHTHGIAHRDLSLENVLLRDDVCKISDFGLSVDGQRVCHEFVGKAYYMAPEVVATVPYDPFAADMWSLGIMLFVMLTGSPLVPLASYDERAFVALQEMGLEEVLEAWGMAADMSRDTIALLVALLVVQPRCRPTIDQVVEYLDDVRR